MPSYVFKYVVSDIDLTPEQINRVGRAVADAGIQTVADIVKFGPRGHVTYQFKPEGLWQGMPPEDLDKALGAYVAEQVGEE